MCDRYFLPGQSSALAKLACNGDKALISRYFFYTDIAQYGCTTRYFTMVRRD